MKRRFPWWLVPVAFIAVPLVEIYVIIEVGQVIGAWWTIGLLVADSIFGAWLIRREGGKAFRALRTALSEGRMPSRELADGVLILVGGTLMLTPGFVTDVVGTFLALPLTRPLGRRLLAGSISRRLIVMGVPGTGTRQDPGPHDVVRGDVVD